MSIENPFNFSVVYHDYSRVVDLDQIDSQKQVRLEIVFKEFNTIGKIAIE